jgi:hypothetical protein
MGLIERANEIRTETQKKANTAQRVGSLFVDIVTPASGRLSYFNQTSLTLVAGVPKKLDLTWNISREVNVNCDPENNEIEILTESEYSCYGMLTFTGSNNTKYDIQLRKNGNLICTCNPQTELPLGRELNITTFDVADFEQGDKLSLWFMSSNSETVNIQRAKLVVKK